MRKMRRLAWLFAIVGTFGLLLGCGEDPPEEKPTFPENPGAITISAEQRGLRMENTRSTRTQAASGKFESLQDSAGALFIPVQTYSEYVQQGAPGEPELDENVDALVDEFADQLMLFDEIYLVVDLQRLDRTWLADWDGLQRDVPENRDVLNFGRDDFKDDVTQYVLNAVNRLQPTAVIIGVEMNRYYSQNSADWDNYVDFFWSLREQIKTTNSNIRVGPGVAWSFLMEAQVAGFISGDELASDVDPFLRAYNTIVAPLVSRDGTQVDFVAPSLTPNTTLYSTPL
ncbi:MAG: hypothetical protein KC561_21075, partial [Myxococcales bacterium]|nr:hypothetical protein [Myxococcales bacterium]